MSICSFIAFYSRSVKIFLHHPTIKVSRGVFVSHSTDALLRMFKFRAVASRAKIGNRGRTADVLTDFMRPSGVLGY